MREAYRDLTRRERQIMDSVYARGSATAAEVNQDLPEPPSYSAVRAMLRKLQDKGYLLTTQDGPRYLYSAVIPRDEARDSALSRVVRTFFDGSRGQAAAALLGSDDEPLSDAELTELETLIRRAREER